LSCTLLTACAATQPVPETEVAAVTTEPQATDEAAVERAFPDSSVYPLLLAEFALRRQDYQTALENYSQQSKVLQDAGVSRHTTHLAQFINDDDSALEAVQLWLEQAPDNLEANNTAATLYARNGQSLKALPHLAFVSRSGKQANYPLVLQGFTDLTPAQQATLVAGLNELALEFPEDPALLLTLALVNTEYEQYEAALARLDALFRIEPDQHQALLLEARLLLQTEAPAPFKRIEKSLARNPEDSRLRLEYARLLTTTDMQAARQQFEVLSAQSPDDAELLLSLALINRETGDDLVARAYLQQVLATGKRQDQAHYYLGRIAEDRKEADRALAHYMQIGDGRQYLGANQRIGRILVGGGQLDASHAWFVKQRQSVPARREQLFGIEADILSSAGARTASMAVLNAGIEAYPDSASLLYARSMLGQQLNDLALMEADLRTIIASDPNNATALNALGYTLADQTGRHEEAYELISRALALEPNEPAILDSMGWILFRQGKLEDALGYLKQAYAAFPDPEVAAHLGEVLWAMGRTDQAREVWQGALLKAPNHSILRATLQRLGVTDLATLPPPGPDTDTSE
jgi:tetratricopeptide (TPR) repeat protein